MKIMPISSCQRMLDRLFGKAKRMILIADDDPAIRSLVKDILDTQGYRVETVGDGQEAIKLLGRKKFDLIILDVHMPRLEGPQALEVIRLMPSCKKMGVIILSLEGMMDTLLDACNKGIYAYIAKPFTPATLIGKVNAYFAGLKKT